MPFPIPPLFDGASTWLQTAHASLTLAAEFLPTRVEDAEFRFRKQLADFLFVYLDEARAMKARADELAARVRREHGTDSDAYRDAMTKVQAIVALFPTKLTQDNKSRMRHIQSRRRKSQQPLANGPQRPG